MKIYWTISTVGQFLAAGCRCMLKVAFRESIHEIKNKNSSKLRGGLGREGGGEEREGEVGK